MGIARLTSVDQAALMGDKAHMIANAPQLRVHQNGFIDRRR